MYGCFSCVIFISVLFVMILFLGGFLLLVRVYRVVVIVEEILVSFYKR